VGVEVFVYIGVGSCVGSGVVGVGVGVGGVFGIGDCIEDCIGAIALLVKLKKVKKEVIKIKKKKEYKLFLVCLVHGNYSLSCLTIFTYPTLTILIK